MMKKLLLSFIISFLCAVSISAQDLDTVTVTAIKANLRGTPAMSGIVVTTVNSGETFELIRENSPWYLVQTPKYVGWLHGNSISLNSRHDADRYESSTTPKYDSPRKPQTTSKPLSTESSPFQMEYVGGESTTILVKNQTDRLLTLVFGGVTYTVSAGNVREIEVDGGRYEYSASVPRAYPSSGVKDFTRGYRFSWTFYIVRR